MNRRHRINITGRVDRVRAIFPDYDTIYRVLRRSPTTQGVGNAAVKQAAEDLQRLLETDLPELVEYSRGRRLLPLPPEIEPRTAVRCCCDWGAASAKKGSGEWPEGECIECPVHGGEFGSHDERCRRHRLAHQRAEVAP